MLKVNAVQGLIMNKYETRKRKRELKRNSFLSQYQNFDNIASIPSLYKATWESAKGVTWKQSTQRYLLNIYLVSCTFLNFRCVCTGKQSRYNL